MEGKVIAICISEARGVQKKPVPNAQILKGWGVKNDAHGGDWHRQVSLLSYERVKEFNKRGALVKNGDFGENILVSDIDLRALKVGTRLMIKEALLEITQIGKECHSHCEIFKRVGDCIMPKEGVFARVLKSGDIAMGDKVRVLTGNLV